MHEQYFLKRIKTYVLVSSSTWLALGLGWIFCYKEIILGAMCVGRGIEGLLNYNLLRNTSKHLPKRYFTTKLQLLFLLIVDIIKYTNTPLLQFVFVILGLILIVTDWIMIRFLDKNINTIVAQGDKENSCIEKDITKKKYCSNCGNLISIYDNYCSKCGTNIKN